MSSIIFLTAAFIIICFFCPDSGLRRMLYLAAGFFILAWWGWNDSGKKLVITRRLKKSRGFAGGEMAVTITVSNRSWFPVFWLELGQSFPVELGAGKEKELIALPPGGSREFRLRFQGNVRGIYSLPPATANFGTAWADNQQDLAYDNPEEIIIYPRILPVIGLEQQRHLPLGQLRVRFGLHEDPARLRGCRNYSPGDSLKRIHWPSLAHTGNLQVKDWETTLHADHAVILNLREEDYPVSDWYSLSELGIELAASLIHRWAEQGESIGFFSNGLTPARGMKQLFCLYPKRGSSQEVKILTYLAGAQVGNCPCYDGLFREAGRMAAGSRLLFITPAITPDQIKRASSLARAGYHPIFIWLSFKKSGLPGEELRKHKIPSYSVEKRRETDVIFLEQAI